MRSSLIVPENWITSDNTADAQLSVADCSQYPKTSSRTYTRDDFTGFAIFNLENSTTVSALPSLDFMTTRVKVWMPALLKILEQCDIDPARYPVILHINEDDWSSWQQGTLDTVSLATAACGRLLWEILSFLYCLVGSWDHVSGFLHREARLQKLNGRCPLHMIQSGDIREIAQLHYFLAVEVLVAPFS